MFFRRTHNRITALSTPRDAALAAPSSEGLAVAAVMPRALRMKSTAGHRVLAALASCLLVLTLLFAPAANIAWADDAVPADGEAATQPSGDADAENPDAAGAQHTILTVNHYVIEGTNSSLQKSEEFTGYDAGETLSLADFGVEIDGYALKTKGAYTVKAGANTIDLYYIKDAAAAAATAGADQTDAVSVKDSKGADAAKVDPFTTVVTELDTETVENTQAVIEADEVPMAAAPTVEEDVIADAPIPLGAFENDVDPCWVHWAALAGLALTVLYSTVIISRRMNDVHDVDDYEAEVLGLDREELHGPATAVERRTAVTEGRQAADV